MADKKPINFPSRAQRKKLIEELQRQGTDPNLAANKNYQDYTSAITKLDNKMEALSAQDDKSVPKNLTEAEAAELAEALAQAAKIGEKYLAAEAAGGKNLNNGVPGMVNHFQGLMSKDFDALKNYDAKDPRSLPEIQESTRTKTIDLRGRNLGSVGNMQNSRIPMTVVDATGKKRSGFFTKAKYVTAKKEFDELIARAKEKCTTDQQRNKLDQFFATYKLTAEGSAKRYGNRTIGEKTNDAYIVGYLGNELSIMAGKDKKVSIDDTKATLLLGGIGPGDIPDKAVKVLRDGFQKLSDDVGLDIDTVRLEIEEGGRVDNRNTAMSSVASLLGCSKLVARSDNMKFIGEDGQVTEGTFMDYADGVDLAKKPHLFKHVATNPFKSDENRKKVFKQIADIQVIDYLCMNEDRHPGNMIYDIDKNGDLRNIQCIDNDSSFGRVTGGVIKAANLRVMSKSMEEKISKLTPEMLKFSLRGRGLSEEELNASGDRLKNLQKQITEKKITVLNDEQFGQMGINSFYPRNSKSSNMFKDLNEFFTTTAKNYRSPDEPFTPLPEQEKPKLKEVYTTDRQRTVGGLTDSLEKVSRKVRSDETGFNVDNLTTRMRGSSPQFKELVSAAKEADVLLKELKQNGELDMTKLAVEKPDVFERVFDAFSKIEQKNGKYLSFKAGDVGADDIMHIEGRNKYERGHINYAYDLQKITKEFFKSVGRPMTEDEREDLQANQQRRELENSRKAQKEPQQGGPALG